MIEHLDTLTKILGGALSALGGGWVSGVLVRRRILQRNLRAVTHEISLIQGVVDEILPLIILDVEVSKTQRSVSTTIHRLPTASIYTACTSGAFDHLQKSELPEKMRALLAAAITANEGIIHREMMMSSTGVYQHNHREKVSTNIALRLKAVENALVEAKGAIDSLTYFDGGKEMKHRLRAAAHAQGERP